MKKYIFPLLAFALLSTQSWGPDCTFVWYEIKCYYS